MRKTNMMTALAFGAMLAVAAPHATAQAKDNAAAASYDHLLGNFEKEILDIAEAMPADKYSWAPSQSDFKDTWKTDFTTPDKARSFGDQLKHVAQANYFFFTQPGQKEPDTGKSIGPLTKKEDIIAALKASFMWAHQQVQAMTPQNAFDAQEMMKQPATRAANISFGMAHINDHMGQLSVYLRMNGIVPPQSRK